MKLLEPRSRLQRFSGITGFLAIASGIATIAINFQNILWRNLFVVLTVILWTAFIVSWVVAVLKSGTIYMKSSQADKREEPLIFWTLFIVLTFFWSGIYWWILSASWYFLSF